MSLLLYMSMCDTEAKMPTIRKTMKTIHMRAHKKKKYTNLKKLKKYYTRAVRIISGFATFLAVNNPTEPKDECNY